MLAEYIPEEEYDSVYSIGVSSDWYYANHILPSYRHFLLFTYIGINPEEAVYFEEYMEKTPPQWLVCADPVAEYCHLLTPATLTIIEDSYRTVATDSRERILYKLIE